MDFFNNGQMDHIDDLMYGALDEFSSGTIRARADTFRADLMQVANRMMQAQSIAATQGARASQAKMRRFLGGTSGQGVGQGLMLGADFGNVANLEYQALRDSYDLALKQSGGRAGILQGGMQATAATPHKSGFDRTVAVGQQVGQYALAASGNPYAIAKTASDAGGTTNHTGGGVRGNFSFGTS